MPTRLTNSQVCCGAILQPAVTVWASPMRSPEKQRQKGRNWSAHDGCQLRADRRTVAQRIIDAELNPWKMHT